MKGRIIRSPTDRQLMVVKIVLECLVWLSLAWAIREIIWLPLKALLIANGVKGL